VIERQLKAHPSRDTFSIVDLDGLPEPVRRYFTAAIAPGTPLAESAHLRMHGRIKLGAWVPFRAQQTLSPHHGFVWQGRALGIVGGFDRYAEGACVLHWKALGVVTVAYQDGPDVDRSGAGRCGAEAMWLPTVLLPRFGVSWTALSDDHIVAAYDVDGTPIENHFHIDERGLPTAAHFSRWGDPAETGTFGWHPFGGQITGHRTFHGLTIPNSGRFGWSFGTPQWDEGEFFRYTITALKPLQ
jgi:hypothetical protein